MNRNKTILVSNATGELYDIVEVRVRDRRGNVFGVPVEFVKSNMQTLKEYNKEKIKPVMNKLRNKL